MTNNKKKYIGRFNKKQETLFYNEYKNRVLKNWSKIKKEIKVGRK